MNLFFETSGEIRSVINKIGRTEDVNFSPDNSRFIIAEFITNKLHLFTVEFDRRVSPPGIKITNYCKITSTDIKNPHGVCFLDDKRIVVCSRYGDVSIFKIPEYHKEMNEFEIQAEGKISGRGLWTAKVMTPGSVDGYQLSENRYRIFVCNNHWHLVTSHIIDLSDGLKIKNEGVLMNKSLSIPDGISISPDQEWIAVSNHVHGQAVIFKNSPDLNKRTEPVNVLEGPVCPHGIRFSPDGKQLFVADAATQYLFIYESEDGVWGTVQNPPRTIKVVDDESFYYGQYGSKEGGVKGIDIDQTHSFLISTHRLGVIEFYDLNALNTVNHETDQEEIDVQRDLRDETFADENESWISNNSPFGLYLAHFILNNRYLKPSKYLQKVNEFLKLTSLRLKNRRSDEVLINPDGPIVSLTSHGERIDTVFYTIESIRHGSVKPSRIILWLDEGDKARPLPDTTLLRLQSVGLEIYYSENIGPHKKYYRFIQQNKEFNKPLVTADDDVIYPKDWLEGLVEAYQKNPSVIYCYRTYRMRLRNGKFIAHNDWHETNEDSPSHLNQITGVSGAIYPPKFLEYLKVAGDQFRSVCPTSDDIWLTVNALRSDFKIAQVEKQSKTFKTIPGTQANSLFVENVIEGKNHHQLIETFTEEDMDKLEAEMNGRKTDYFYSSKSSALT